jgi:hypothetical protein
MHSTTISFAFVAVALVSVTANCGSPTPSATCNDDVTATASDAVVSFSKDVMPLFAQSCAFSSCHGASTGKANGVYLGSDRERVHTATVGAKGLEHPTMLLVAAGKSRESYLMRKMDGTQCALDAQCTGAPAGTPGCQSSMPKGDVPLDLATRDIVRRWIAQGAKND